MRISRVPILLLLIPLLLAAGRSGASATTELDVSRFVPVDELARGDRCVGLTVFEGTRIEEFTIEIIDVVRDVSPGSDLIIGRAEGDILEKTGILEGMSGSPVYKDGRLVGAVASTWSFTKEPIAGITPIAEMLPALDMLDAGRGEEDGFGSTPVRSLDLIPEHERSRSALALLARSIDARAVLPVRGPQVRPDPAESAYGMTPIAAPLVVSGADDSYLSAVSGTMAGSRFVPVRGSSRGADETPSELRPGSVVGVQFVRGDVSWSAIGTVTHTDGDRVIAFGHPLFGAGEIEMPMVAGYVHALLPLQSVSFKYASGGALLGTMMEDRNRMVAGVAGRFPEMLPVEVRVEGAGAGPATYRFEVVRSRSFASYFAGLAAGGAISAAAKSSGPATVELAVRIDASAGSVEYSDIFHTTGPARRCAGELALLLSLINDNRFLDPEIRRVEVDVSVRDEESWFALDRVEADRSIVRPGEDLNLTVSLRPRRGDVETRAVHLYVPPDTPDGPLLVRVGDASSFHEWEAERLGPGMAPRGYDQLTDLVRRSRSGDTVVAQLLSDAPGFSLMGAEVREAPGRVGLAMVSGAASGTVDPSLLSVVAESEMGLGRPVFGRHEFVVEVKRER